MLSFVRPLVDSITISEVESETISEMEITATLELKRHEFDNERHEMAWKIIKCYHGKSTRPVTGNQTSDELMPQKIMMEEEAKKAALMEYYRDHLGITECNDLVFDELHRPLKLKSPSFELPLNFQSSRFL